MTANNHGATPRIRARLSREEQAAAELGCTEFAPGTRGALVCLFLATISAVPLIQLASARRESEGGRGGARSLHSLMPDAAPHASARGPDGLLGLFPEASRLKAIEEHWERNSVVGEAVLPRVQRWLLAVGQGNEKAYAGRGGWLFFRPDVDHVAGRGFLEPDVLRRRGAEPDGPGRRVQPDPVRAIVDFRDQLALRDIALLVVPAPVKPTIHPEQFAEGAGGGGALQNPSFGEWVARLRSAGVAVFDPSPTLMKARAAGTPVYLKTDTHWTPAAMESAAAGIAEAARAAAQLPAAEAGRYQTVTQTVSGAGDIALMLRLQGPPPFPRETVVIQQVTDGTRLWRPSPDAPVLFLGDSFANIYSLQPMGWGESAGLAEHLSARLGLPVDAICRNDQGSHATREMLARELRRGRDRLEGKRLVIWEFAARELSSGTWRMVPMEVGQKRPATLYEPPPGRVVRVRGTVRAASPVPRTGSVPYKDHIMTIRLGDLESPDEPSAAGREVIVLAWSMRDHAPTAASRWRAGDDVEMVLRPWAEVAAQHEAINRSELDDEDAMLAEPAWAVADGE